jgi:hypothetical protein
MDTLLRSESVKGFREMEEEESLAKHAKLAKPEE